MTTPTSAREALRQATASGELHVHYQNQVTPRQDYTRLLIARRGSALCGTPYCLKIPFGAKVVESNSREPS